MESYQVVVLGYGEAGQTHARAWRQLPNVRVLSVDSDRGRGADLPCDALAFIKDPPVAFDILDICLPHHLHLHAVQLAEALGRPYIKEKPLGRSLAEAREIAALNQATGIPAMVAENWVYVPVVQALLGVTQAFNLGRCRFFRGHVEFKPKGAGTDWYLDEEKAGGGVLLSAGVHIFAIARRLLGEPRGLSWAAVLHHHRVENGIVCAFHFDPGIGLFVIDREARRSPGLYQCTAIYEHGTVDCDIKQGLLRIHTDHGTTVQEFPASMGVAEELQHFLAVLAGAERPQTMLQSELGTMQMVEAVYTALRSRDSLVV